MARKDSNSTKGGGNKGKSSDAPIDQAWTTDAPVEAEPLPLPPGDDFEFPELDAVLSEHKLGAGDDTGADLPRGIAAPPLDPIAGAGWDEPDAVIASPDELSLLPMTDEPPAKEPPAKEPPAKETRARVAARNEPTVELVAVEPVAQPPAKEPPAKEPPATKPKKAEPTAVRVVDVPMPPPAEPPTDTGSVLDDHASFSAEARRLARAREWQSLAALTSAAIDHSPWARQVETRTSLLTDLARLYRDRLRDLPSAEDQFRRLVEVAPAEPEANQFLAQRFRDAGEWRALYDLRVNAAEATWDPDRRVEWTREAARIAVEELHADELAIAAWERLWRSGDAADEAARALSDGYRRAGLWDRLGEFLLARAEEVEGGERVVLLREAAEAYLTGDRDHDAATRVLGLILEAHPDDPVALLGRARVLARRADWAALAELGTHAVAREHEQPFADVRRIAADALWSAGEHERAVAVFDCILAWDPSDADALKAKEEHLARKGDVAELVALLHSRAQQTAEPAKRASLLERAAELAVRDLNDPRRAAELLEQRATIVEGRAEALDRLADLYDTLGDREAVRRVLEERLALVRGSVERVELLRRLGEHCVQRLGDDARAESCWREILDSVPDDRAVREELIALYRRRGDFEAVDRAWSAFAWRPLDDESLAGIWRAAAVNVQDNLTDATRTVRAWRRVLDLRPEDATARLAIVTQLRATEDRAALVDALDARSDAAAPAEKLAAWAEMARLYERDGATTAALATYERILCAAPRDAAALDAIVRLYGADRAGVARGAFEVALARGERDGHAELVRRTLPLVGSDALERLLTLRRMLAFSPSDPSLVAELAAQASEVKALGSVVALFEELAASAPDLETRHGHHQRLAALYEEAGDPIKALLTLSTARQRVPSALAELAPILRLCDATGRHEDAFALLGVAAALEAPADVRRAALRERQQLAEHKLGDPARAFYQAAWLVRLDAGDGQAIADAERLARAARVWRDLDGLYAELWDRARTDGERVAIARKRRDLRAGELGDPSGALDFTILLYRLEPSPELAAELWQAAAPLSAWARVLPVIEGRLRQGAAAGSELGALADVVADKLGDAPHAFELYGSAFVGAASSTEVEAKLQAAAGAIKAPLRLAHRLREAAAHVDSPLRAIELYRHAADGYRAAGEGELALDVHRRILQLQPRAIDSYDVAFAHLRQSAMWRELRDLLEQRLEVDEAQDAAGQLSLRLEIARISRAELRDLETALRSYAAILERYPDQEEALVGVRALTDGTIDPRLELERLRLELGRAAGARRVEILLQASELQERQLGDLPGAVATIQKLVAESGPGGAGYAPMLQLLQKSGAWVEVIDLMQQRAAVVTDARERIELVRAAITVAETHAVARERLEKLTQELLAAAPDDAPARSRLLDAHRRAGRWVELDALLVDTLGRIGADAGEERRLYVAERLRVLPHALARSADAEALARAETVERPNDEDLLLWLASSLRRRGDHAGYAALRKQQVRLMAPRLGALVLCELAESAHDADGVDAAIALYREARALDPDNRFAAEGLKALGRRSRNWRAAASLLPGDDTAQLTPAERAARLTERGVALVAENAAAAVEHFERALAIDADAVAAWDGLSAAARALGDERAAWSSARSALLAGWRSTAPAPQLLGDEARRFDNIATLAFACDEGAVGTLYARRAWELDPSLPTAALAVARQAEADGRVDEARAILGGVLDRGARLEPAQRLDASFRLGLLVARAGGLDAALGHFRDGLRVDPLHPGLLNAVAEVLAQKKRTAAAIQHYIQALMLAHDERRRGNLYARIGGLWADALRAPEEAGVCYQLAVAHGVDDSEVMLGALAHYRQNRRHAEAARIIDQLLPRATTPAALAALWTERGALLAATDDEANAVDAFDMALSYDPSCRGAVDGLARVLEKRGEWQQLIELLEPRVDVGTPEQRADAMRRLAAIAKNRQKDATAAERFLRRAVALNPVLADYDELMGLLGDGADSQRERDELMAARLALAGPFTPALTQLGIRLTAEGRRRWAWALLSPLMVTIIQDAALKSLVLELRREFEKLDTMALLTPSLHRELSTVAPALLDVLAELDELVPFGPATPEAAKAGRASRVDGKTVLGRTFTGIAQRLGIADAVLTRAEDLAVICRVLDDTVPHVVVRADVFAMLSPVETTAMLAYALEEARPGARMLASLDGAEAGRVVAALFAAVGRVARTDELEPLCRQIEEAAGKPRLDRWAAQLSACDDLVDRVAPSILQTAERVALFAAGELRFACKLLSRIDGRAQLPTTGKLDELERFFAESESGRRVLSFAVSPTFGELFKEETGTPETK